MQRDMDLCRRILLFIADNDDPKDVICRFPFIEYTQEQINYHIDLLDDAGFVRKLADTSRRCVKGTLSWEAHNFIDDIRNDNIWNNTKKRIKESAGSASFQIFVQVAKEMVKSSLDLSQ